MPRREINDNSGSWDDHYAQVAYTADALALAGQDGDREVGALAPAAEKVTDRWEPLDDERRQKRRAVGRANARVKRRDVQAEQAATALHNDVLARSDQKRSAPLFERFFLDPLSAFIKLSLESSLPELRAIKIKLAAAETPAEVRKAHADAIDQALTLGAAAIHEREEAIIDATRTTMRITTWREDANRVLLGIEGKLLQLAATRGLGRDWVDSFFPDAPGKKGKKEKKVKPGPTP